MGCNNPPAGGQPVPLYYCNPDIIYADEFPASRFGQGRSCFAAALDTVSAAVSLCSFWLQNMCMMKSDTTFVWYCCLVVVLNVESQTDLS